MPRNKILFLTAFCLLTLCTASVCAEEKTLVLGGKEGWPALSKMDGVVRGTGRYGWECIELDTNARKVNEATDVLIDFENGLIADCADNYSVTKNELIVTDRGKMGKYAALSRGTGGLRLSGKKGSLFGSSGAAGSFVIEFWLNPSIAENGEIVLSWRSSRTVRNYPLYQMISASFESNHLQWTFTNVFNGYTDNGGELKIQSYHTIIPDVWTHHSISYDDNTGLLEYRINGLLEVLSYVTSNGREVGGSVYTPELGVVADLDICPQFTGLVDDFRIQRLADDSTSRELYYDTYRQSGGRFETQPVFISRGARLNSINALVTVPEQTAVALFVRSGENFFNWTDTEPEWIPVENGENLTGVEGAYFQVAMDLFPDGGGHHTPSVTELTLSYTEVMLPIPPFTLTAEPGDGEVTLYWTYSIDNSSGGYYVYYGTRPGEYLGREAVQGESPINVGNKTSVTLTGLKNGTIYYFAVSSYSNIDEKIMGELSKEVYARPLKSSKVKTNKR